jgi:hypothetical protein
MKQIFKTSTHISGRTGAIAVVLVVGIIIMVVAGVTVHTGLSSPSISLVQDKNSEAKQKSNADYVEMALGSGINSVRARAYLRDMGPAVIPLLDNISHDYPQLATSASWEELYDLVAAQRDARVSRLYWYTDIMKAQQAAKALHRPILSLRLLGSLTDEYSCANSRLFRAIMYPDPTLGNYLRDHCVLFWSSERPVPQVTIDLGDGHRLHGTLGGNSIHYLLDENLTVLDAFPGLYNPVFFLEYLKSAIGLSELIRMNPLQKSELIKSFHNKAINDRDIELAKTRVQIPDVTINVDNQNTHLFDILIRASTGSIDPSPQEEEYHFESLVINSGWHSPSSTNDIKDSLSKLGNSETMTRTIGQAEMLTYSKSFVEMPILRGVGVGDPTMRSLIPATAMVSLQNLFKHHLDNHGCVVLDRQLTELNQLSMHPLPLAIMKAEVEYELEEDTVVNEIVLHNAIHTYLMKHPEATFSELNAWVYSALFQTPREDEWLGLVPLHFDGIDHHLE